ncbi:MAG: hypothetical protein ACYCZX_15765 [Rhodospirillaceae bacterium]
MKLPQFSMKLPDLPRPVAISVGIMIVSAAAFGVLLPTLGLSRDEAIAESADMQTQIAGLTKDFGTAKQDRQFVLENQSRYEVLLQSDRLVPHTRRDAVQHMQQLARARGLTTLNYDFIAAGEKSVAATTSQAKTSAYRVNVENITLRLGAPLDGAIYGFIADIANSFPGAAIVASIDMERAPKVTPEMLAMVSRGQDSGLVKGEVKLLWRTAQINDAEKKAP